MKIYLTRHGNALPSSIDPEKGLSPEGAAHIEKIAKFLGVNSFPLQVILHSEKKRARETAKILGELIAPEVPLTEHAHMAPNDPIDSILDLIEGDHEEVLIVGHLPYLSKLLGHLVSGDESVELVTFDEGTTVCVEGSYDHWAIKWVLSYDLL